MSTLRRLAPVILLTAGLAGCASGPRGPLTAENNPSLYSVHQPVVQRSDYFIDLDAAGDTLSAAERARLVAWFETIELRYADHIYVDEPRDYPSPGARGDVGSVLGEYGMLLQNGAPVLPGAIAPGTVRVIASRATASVADCPNWHENPARSSVATSPNYGCAFNQNLAAMIADPNDLVRGRTGSANGSGALATRAVRVYRDRTPSGGGALPTVSTRSGGQ